MSAISTRNCGEKKDVCTGSEDTCACVIGGRGVGVRDE